jgi:hypothetical protein
MAQSQSLCAIFCMDLTCYAQFPGLPSMHSSQAGQMSAPDARDFRHSLRSGTPLWTDKAIQS